MEEKNKLVPYKDTRGFWRVKYSDKGNVPKELGDACWTTEKEAAISIECFLERKKEDTKKSK